MLWLFLKLILNFFYITILQVSILQVSLIQRNICTQLCVVGTADSVLIGEVPAAGAWV